MLKWDGKVWGEVGLMLIGAIRKESCLLIGMQMRMNAGTRCQVMGFTRDMSAQAYCGAVLLPKFIEHAGGYHSRADRGLDTQA